MGRAFVTYDHPTPHGGLPLAFALHQHMHPAVQRGDFRFLTGNHIRKIVDDAGQMGDLFFEFFHTPPLTTGWGGRKGGGLFPPDRI